MKYIKNLTRFVTSILAVLFWGMGVAFIFGWCPVEEGIFSLIYLFGLWYMTKGDK